MGLSEAFEKELISTGRVDRRYLGIWGKVEELKREVVDEKRLERLESSEVYRLREEVRKLIDELKRVVKEELNEP